ncbi:MAG TPA: hypothetical protein VEU06_06035 [Micropepsaceae bacterium]|nr:hypothetical protein [Micropepsaceae bacterium]
MNMIARRALTLTAVLVAATACATRSLRSDDASITTSKVEDALKQPLRDLNLAQDKISPLLLKVRSDPYALPADVDCHELNAEIAELDGVLGPDLDIAPAKKDSIKKATSDTVLGAARDTASGFIPYRGVVRRVSGAEERSKTISQAQLAGSVRRAYLKGMGEHMGCESPASPHREQAAAAAPQ